MPFWNWNQITETGDLKYLFKTCKGRVSKELGEVWEDLQDQHFREFGQEDVLKARIRTMKKLIELNNKFVQTGQRHLLNFINIEELKLQEGEKSHFKLYQTKDVLERDKGFRIVCSPNDGTDPNQITVVEWYWAAKNLVEKSKKQNGKS
jgi:hypothetical protein